MFEHKQKRNTSCLSSAKSASYYCGIVKSPDILAFKKKIINLFLCVQWFSLDDVASGKLHLKLEWLSLLSTPDKLDQVRSGVAWHICLPAFFLPWCHFLLRFLILRLWPASAPTAAKPTTASLRRSSSSSWTRRATFRWAHAPKRIQKWGGRSLTAAF